MPAPQITINDVNVEQLQYQGEPVVTIAMVARVHSVDEANVHKSFQRHQERFTEGTHYFRIDSEEASRCGLRVQTGQHGAVLFTRKGYLLLVKPMRDDRAWIVQERMIDDYFTLRDAAQARALPEAPPSDTDAVAVALTAFPEMRAMMALVEQVAVLRLEQQQQKDALIATQAQTIEAHNLATRALEGQLWMTLRQYRHVHSLASQLTDKDLSEFGRYLTGYCLEHNIPVGVDGVGDRGWGRENRYHMPTIEALLPDWLKRRNAQGVLAVVPQAREAR